MTIILPPSVRFRWCHALPAHSAIRNPKSEIGPYHTPWPNYKLFLSSRPPCADDWQLTPSAFPTLAKNSY